jgi:hypothetical protein
MLQQNYMLNEILYPILKGLVVFTKVQSSPCGLWKT